MTKCVPGISSFPISSFVEIESNPITNKIRIFRFHTLKVFAVGLSGNILVYNLTRGRVNSPTRPDLAVLLSIRF